MGPWILVIPNKTSTRGTMFDSIMDRVSGEYVKEQMVLKRIITWTGLARSKGELKCIKSDDERVC